MFPRPPDRPAFDRYVGRCLTAHRRPARDVIAKPGCLDPPAHLGELGDEAGEGFGLGENRVGGSGLSGLR